MIRRPTSPQLSGALAVVFASTGCCGERGESAFASAIVLAIVLVLAGSWLLALLTIIRNLWKPTKRSPGGGIAMTVLNGTIGLYFTSVLLPAFVARSPSGTIAPFDQQSWTLAVVGGIGGVSLLLALLCFVAVILGIVRR